MRKPGYELHPVIEISGCDDAVIVGYEKMVETIRETKHRIVVCDVYPGVDTKQVVHALSALHPVVVVDTSDLLKPLPILETQFSRNITDDRVFGFMSHHVIESCFDEAKLNSARELVASTDSAVVLIVGVGASLVSCSGLLLYFDLTRWEIQKRYAQDLPNWLADNPKADALEKFKRGYFLEWRIADRHKISLFDSVAWFIDTHENDHPKMIAGDVLRDAIAAVATRPFRMEPYFNPGVWGGQWMKQHFGLPNEAPNYAWCFDGIVEENCINLEFGGEIIKIPANNVVFSKPHELLGEKVHGRYGLEFPIRFDLLDTMGGGNLSLQVHPLTEYIQQEFGMHYTQDESYYILDAGDVSVVYLGVKNDCDKETMLADLDAAEHAGASFPVQAYVNAFPVQKHDHILIPAGTIHCSGKDTMVLEISATPYIFTFKLWDWGRLGLDGQPRPVHLAHGKRNIQWDRDTDWVKAQLLEQAHTVSSTPDYEIEQTGLHIREPIITFRYTVRTACPVIMDDSVQMLNLVEGERALITSPSNAFAPFEVHYAQTFIIPASVREYCIIAPDDDPVILICAQIR